jgi:hypothetical protein
VVVVVCDCEIERRDIQGIPRAYHCHFSLSPPPSDISKWDVSAASHSTVFSSAVENQLLNLPNYQKFDNGRPLGMVNMFSKNAEYHVGADNFYMRLHPKTVSQFSHALCSEAWLSAPIQHLNVKDEVFLCDGIINSKNFALASKDYDENYHRDEWTTPATYNKTNDLFLPTKPVGAAKWWGPIENWYEEERNGGLMVGRVRGSCSFLVLFLFFSLKCFYNH